MVVAYEAYIGYLTDRSRNLREEIRRGVPFVLEVRDIDTFERLVVRAIVSDSPDALPEGAELWVLDWIENRQPAPWRIRVLEEAEEAEPETARSDVTDADRAAAGAEARKYGGAKYRGAELPDSMGGEEARKYYENIVSKRRTD